ncbi:hypothetical protein, partial [Amycolatopsis keratiniphila]|uniref:hypothetical protein n=1 Tax=Amycolatopsis keratiniphila TaxID=129921 RepID=UPI001B7FF825
RTPRKNTSESNKSSSQKLANHVKIDSHSFGGLFVAKHLLGGKSVLRYLEHAKSNRVAEVAGTATVRSFITAQTAVGPPAVAAG